VWWYVIHEKEEEEGEEEENGKIQNTHMCENSIQRVKGEKGRNCNLKIGNRHRKIIINTVTHTYTHTTLHT